jgi:hypothetical protein
MSVVAPTTTDGRRRTAMWSPARVYLVLAGIYLVILGGAGFFYDASFPTSTGTVGHDHIFGVFETNGWHNVAGLLFGVIALAFLARPERARLGALVVGLPNAIVFVAFALWDPRSFLIASNGADQVVHALLGFGGIVAALATRQALQLRHA